MPRVVFCPICGARLERRFTEGRDREVCSSCGYVFYRNPVPAVGVVVSIDEQVVLVRRKFEPRAGCWGLPAGYMELGESAEEAAIRECQEETGLTVQIDELLGVYSFGTSEESGLVIIYAATPVGGALAAGDDAQEAGLFPIDDLPSPFAFRTHLQALQRYRRSVRRRSADHLLADEQFPAAVVRGATRADAQAILALLGEDLAGDADRRVAVDALLHDWLADPDHPILVAEIDHEIVGVALLSLRQSLRGWHATLDHLIVLPTFRRRGIGVALVETASHLARKRGCAAIHVGTTHQTDAAEAFLAARGFVTGEVLTRRLHEPEPDH